MQKWKLWSTEKRSSRVLYALVGLIIIVFALFWLIGFDRPFDDDPNFNSPLFTDALLIVTALIFLFGVGLAVWSVVRSPARWASPTVGSITFRCAVSR